MKLADNKQKVNIGLAISGGWIRSVCAIGVIEVLEENKIPISLVAGTSAGAGIAGPYAAGTLPQLKERLITASRRDWWQVVIEPGLPKKGLLKGERINQFFSQYLGEKQFCDLNKKLFIASTDLRKLEPVILSEGSVKDAISASLSVPGIFVPIRQNEKVLADGGHFNLIPSKILYERGADYVIAVDASQKPNSFNCALAELKKILGWHGSLDKLRLCVKDDFSIFGLTWRATHLTSNQINNLYHGSYRYDCLIKPDIAGVKRWHVSKVKYLINQGRLATEKVIDKIKSDIYGN
jgi:NTE family protein